MSSQAVLFAAHAYARSSFGEFARIRDALPDGADGFLLWDQAGNARYGRKLAELPRHEFDRGRLPEALGYPFFLDSGILPGSSHFPVMKFARERPYDYYWFIEYDVRFTGDWRVLFEHFDGSDDFVACRMSRHAAEPDWHWWDSLSHPEEEIALGERLRSFNPIYRISRRALEYVDETHRQGWRGHHEVLLATLLERGGFALRDFGGTGPFVRSEDRNRFYLEADQPDGLSPWIGAGSVRWRPHHFALRGRPRNKLYHPVSPSLWAHLRPGRSRPRLPG